MSTKILTAVLVLSMLFAAGASAFASEASEAVNNFAFNAGKFLMDSSAGKDFFFSPFSILSAFGMSYAGACGQTAKEIESALGITQDIHSSLGALTRDLNRSGYLSSANRVWLKNGLNILANYSGVLKLYYDSQPYELDMKNHNEESRREINGWVESKTNGKIKDLIKNLDPETRMVITNAVYFNAEWRKKFPKSLTEDEKFFTDGANFVEVPMMKQRDDFAYAEVDGVKAVMLQYKGRRLSMIVALPPEDNADFLKTLNAETFAKLLASMRTYDVDIWLPKFKTENRYELKDLFEALGIRTAFTDLADFSGITRDEPLKADEVIHQTFIDVDEEKTEAAAATAMIMLGATAMPEMKKPFAEFHADRPFLYFIRDNETGTILFMGYQSFK